MQRYLPLFLLFFAFRTAAQSIIWLSPCTDTTFCLDQGSCTQATVVLAVNAVTTCLNSSFINYSYKIDLNNNGSIDIQSSEDTLKRALPVGTHLVLWRANDNCGNISSDCGYLVTVRDCNPPNLLCLNGLTQNLEFPECEASFDVQDFIINATDNCTPANQLQFGMRVAGTGTGFPTETVLTFGQCEQGLHILQIWVRDGNNLANSCNSYVLVQDNAEICPCDEDANLQLTGCVRGPDSSTLDGYTIRTVMEGIPQQGLPFTQPQQKSYADSCFTMSFNTLPLNGSYSGTVRAQRAGDPLAGVSTFDLVTINKHILGQQPLKNFYQVLASDVNGSKTITTFDIIEIRKLILGIYDTFPNAPSWRFILPLPDTTPLTGFGALRDTYAFSVPNLTADTLLHGFDFVGVKMGDANSNASLVNHQWTDRGAPLALQAEDRFLEPGQSQWVSFTVPEQAILDGWQLALGADPEQLVLSDVRGVSAQESALLSPGDLRIACLYDRARVLPAGEVLFQVLVTALQPVRLADALFNNKARLQPEAYPAGEPAAVRALQLQVGDGVSGIQFFPPRPNPFVQETLFPLSLEAASPVTLEVYSTTGARVYQNTRMLEAGEHHLRLLDSDLPGAGIWTYRLQAGDRVESGRLVRL